MVGGTLPARFGRRGEPRENIGLMLGLNVAALVRALLRVGVDLDKSLSPGSRFAFRSGAER